MKDQFAFPEGATPIADCSDLIPTWVHHINDLNRVEAENILKAQRRCFRRPIHHPKEWFHIKSLKVIHKDMFGNVWKWAGNYRKSITVIGIQPNLIPYQLAEFCYEVLSWFEHPVELTFVEMAARIHHKLVYIHPFENGNGRFARLIADRFLYSLECKFPHWPDDLHKTGLIRNEYIQVLKKADKGNYSFLVEFMKKCGACDPKLCELFRNDLYRFHLQDKHGLGLVKALIRNGENVNDETSSGHRALQLSIKAECKEIAKYLVEVGAEVNYVDKSLLTAYQMALKKENRTLADFLVAKGAKRLT